MAKGKKGKNSLGNRNEENKERVAVDVDVVNNSCDEEKITLKQIRNLFAEMFTNMFKKHEEMITQILSENTKLVNERIEQLDSKIKDLETSL